MVDFVEDTDNHVFFAHDGNGFANGAIDGVEKGERKRVPEYYGMVGIGVGEESAVAERERLDFGEV